MNANTTMAPTEAKKEQQTLSIIKHFEKIVDATKDKKISQESLEVCREHSNAVAEKLSITPTQALFLAVFADQCDDESIRIADLAKHFDCRNINVMCYSEDIDVLAEKGYIRKRKSNNQRVYRMPAEVISALKKNEVYVVPSVKGLTIQKVFEELARMFKEREEEELTFYELRAKALELVGENGQLHFSKTATAYKLLKTDLLLLLFFCHSYVTENDDSIGSWDFEFIYDSKSDLNCVKNALEHQHHSLITQNIVEVKKSENLANRNVYCLTDEAKKELLSELNLHIEEQPKPKNIILAKDVTAKSLFYNSREQGQIGQLTSLLDGDNFAKVQRRLSKNGMRKGFACLFYGSPGTGKTETVYQVARRTGRDIMYVNVSEIKSMWVGESEKNIKSLFDRYRNFCKQSANTPILLFNEADAVIGIRQEAAERAVDKMENSIQNIILQEMETLDGIMIATTNLTQNLDPAFERRFLFKIEFDKPGIEAKTAIWRSMMPELSEPAATELANSYNFSGGQIENIARKRTVDHIIQGRRPNLAMIHNYCKSELINNNRKERKPIGF